MELPWNKKERLQEENDKLEEEIKEVRDERDRYREKLDAEEKRRSKLSKEKQEAQEKLNRLQDKLKNKEKTTSKEESGEEGTKWAKLDLNEIKNILEKLDSVKSPEKDLVTVKSTERIENLPDLKGLKNTLNSSDYSSLSSEKSFFAFIDGKIFSTVLKTRKFFKKDWKLDQEFHTDELKDFIESEKHWAIVSAGKTQVFHEENGEFEEVDRVTTRVENQQKKGGFSQGRFERKRDEQVEEHVKKTKELIKDFENLKVLGNKKLCKELKGEYLGGFDSSREPSPEMFYDFRLKRLV